MINFISVYRGNAEEYRPTTDENAIAMMLCCVISSAAEQSREVDQSMLFSRYIWNLKAQS